MCSSFIKIELQTYCTSVSNTVVHNFMCDRRKLFSPQILPTGEFTFGHRLVNFVNKYMNEKFSRVIALQFKRLHRELPWCTATFRIPHPVRRHLYRKASKSLSKCREYSHTEIMLPSAFLEFYRTC
jgi:hypothetical protein